MKNFDIEDPITKLNQVSTKRGEVLIANKISTLKDLLHYLPRKHLDRSNITKIKDIQAGNKYNIVGRVCLLYTSPSPRDGLLSRMPSSA